jgi:hypothetical protein
VVYLFLNDFAGFSVLNIDESGVVRYVLLKAPSRLVSRQHRAGPPRHCVLLTQETARHHGGRLAPSRSADTTDSGSTGGLDIGIATNGGGDNAVGRGDGCRVDQSREDGRHTHTHVTDAVDGLLQPDHRTGHSGARANSSGGGALFVDGGRAFDVARRCSG